MLLAVLAVLGGPGSAVAPAARGGARGGGGAAPPTAAGGAQTARADNPAAATGNADGNGNGNGNADGNGNGNGTAGGQVQTPAQANGGARGGGAPPPTGAGGGTGPGGHGHGLAGGSGSTAAPACRKHCQTGQGSAAQAIGVGIPVIQGQHATTAAPVAATTPVGSRAPVPVLATTPTRQPITIHRRAGTHAHRSSDVAPAPSALDLTLSRRPPGSAALLTGLHPSAAIRLFTGLGAVAAPLPPSPLATTGRLAPVAQAVGHIAAARTSLQTPNVISRIERVVPEWVWLGLGAALLLAFVAGGSALWNAHRVQRQNQRVAEITAAALSDPLTGVLNRRGFFFEAERELARAQRHERPFTLAYTDVRGLKPVNDTLGHRSGDRLLRSVAHLLRDNARAGDAVGRLGGDEFGLLLVEQDAYGAEAVAVRIQAAISEQRRALALEVPWDLTIGLATYPEDGNSIAALLQRADERLYRQRGITVRSL